MKSPAKPSSAQLRLPSVQELEVARGDFVSSETYRAGVKNAPKVLDILDALTEARGAVDAGDVRGAISWIGLARDTLDSFEGLARVCDVGQTAHGYFTDFIRGLIQEKGDLLRSAKLLYREIPGYEKYVLGNA